MLATDWPNDAASVSVGAAASKVDGSSVLKSELAWERRNDSIVYPLHGTSCWSGVQGGPEAQSNVSHSSEGTEERLQKCHLPARGRNDACRVHLKVGKSRTRLASPCCLAALSLVWHMS